MENGNENENGITADRQANNPLHGVTLEMIVIRLVEHFGWAELGQRIAIRCFTFDPGVKSSLAFLRKTPWAQTKVEKLYLATFHKPPAVRAKSSKESA